MSDSINEACLADVVEFIVDNRGRTAPAEEHGIPLIATNCVSNEHLYPLKEKLRYVSQETYENWFRSHPIPGDILLTNKGSQNGAICLVPDPVDFCIAQDMVALRADQNKIYPLYLFAVLRSKLVQNRIKELNVDAVIPHFKKTDFNKLYFPLLGEREQKFIGDLYFKLSYKIELNHQINQTLEAMAQAIFKSWFVDFEPVKVKMAAVEAGEDAESVNRTAMRAISGKSDDELDKMQAEQPDNYTQLKATAELFPAAMQDSELGEIPEGWEAESLYDVAQYINGAAFKSEDFSSNQEGLPIIKISELKYGIKSQTEFTKKEFDQKYRITNGEILFSWSGSPDTSIDIFLWTGGTGWLNQHTFRVIPQEAEEKAFIFFLLKFFKRSFIEIARNKQTTGLGHVTSKDLKNMFVAFPTEKVIKLFNDVGEPIVSQIFCNSMENNNLSRIRDLLLPKLLSGELSVDAAKLAEE